MKCSRSFEALSSSRPVLRSARSIVSAEICRCLYIEMDEADALVDRALAGELGSLQDPEAERDGPTS